MLNFLIFLHLQAFKIDVSMKKFYNLGSRPWNYEGLFARMCHLGLHDPIFQSQEIYSLSQTDASEEKVKCTCL